MERVLTDPDLRYNDEELMELQSLRKKNLKVGYLETENCNLRKRLGDLEKTVKINKEIIGALVDSLQNNDFQSTFHIFQLEIQNQMEQAQRYYLEMESIAGQLLICQQIKEEQYINDKEQIRILEGQAKEMKETLERKEYSLQNVERRLYEYENLLKEVSEYDNYVKMQLADFNVVVSEQHDTISITNVVHENKKLQKEIEAANQEVQRLRQAIEMLQEMNENLAINDNSIADIKILNTLLRGNDPGEYTRTTTTPNTSMKQVAQSARGTQSKGVDLPSIQLFKRMTNLKREKQHLEREVAALKEMLDEARFLNQKLDEALRHQQEKVARMEQEQNRKGESTAVGDTSLFKDRMLHKRKLSFDPKFLAEASPQQMNDLKASLIEGTPMKDSLFFDISAVL